MKINKMQERYLLDELFGLTLGATVQRAGVYAPKLTEKQRARFQDGLKRALEKAALGYSVRVSSGTHTKRIVALAARLTRRHAGLLAKGRLRIGVAQKSLNLYLKYLWCAGRIPEPPHCPFDYRVIQLLRRPERKLTWTTLDTPAQYRALVAAAKAVAGRESLAAWELREYNQKSAAALRAQRMP